jgi:aspartyl/asparaginyl beta-hydroxylase (cupin superfamily)
MTSKDFFFYIGFSLFNNITKSAMFGRVSVEHRIINPTIIRAQLGIIFLEMNTTINNIHLSIEA